MSTTTRSTETATVKPELGPIRRLLPMALQERRLLGWSVFAGLAFNIAALSASTLGAWIVGQATTGSDAGRLRPAIFLLVVVVPAASVLMWWWMKIVHDFAYSILAVMRIRVFEGLARLAPRWIYGRRTGDLGATVMGDVEVTERFFAHTIADYIIAITITFVSTVMLFMIHPWIAVILPVVALAIATVPFWLAKRAESQGQKWRAGLGVLTADVVDGVQGLRELISFGETERFSARLDERTSALQEAQLDYGRRAGLEAGISDLLQALATFAVLGVAAWLVSSGRMEASSYPVAVLLTSMSLIPVAAVTQTARELGEVSASAGRILAVVDHPPSLEDTATDPPAPPESWTVAFDDVRFRYNLQDAEALSGASFEIAPGETVALVGRSGAGKSTCASLLTRLWDPDTGAVRVGGTDLCEWPEEDLRAHITTVPQEVYLFNSSIRDNIRLGTPTASDDDVEAAARGALAHEFIVSELPDGYDTVCGERGVELSGGQRQRVAIARALLKDAPVLIMDEAVSNLDAESERALRVAMANVAKGRTTMLIAHRLSTVRSADRVVVLEEGKVIESGRHDDLIQAGGTYASLFVSPDPDDLITLT